MNLLEINNIAKTYSLGLKLLSSVLCDHPRYRKKLSSSFDEPIISWDNHTGCNYLTRCEKASALCRTQTALLCTFKEKHKVACLNL